MGDKNRFKAFADFLLPKISKNARIADIAGGKGWLQAELRLRGFQNVCTFDRYLDTRRTKNGVSWYCQSFFETDFAKDFDVLLGLHPDGATDTIIFSAAKYEKKFCLVPCCLTQNQIPFLRPRKIKGIDAFDIWCEHLISSAHVLGMQTKVDFLPISGRNKIIMRL